MYLWLKSEVPLVILMFINLVVTAIAGYLTPRLITQFYDSFKKEAEFDHYFWLLLGLFLAEYANRFVFQVCSHRYIQILLNQIRGQSFSLWLKAPFKKKAGGKHDEYPMGEVLARLMNDTDAVREIVSSGSFGIFIDIIFILSSLISFLELNSTTGLAIFLAEIVAVFLLIKGSKAMAFIFMDVRKVTGYLAREITDLTSGLRELFFSPNNHYASRRGEKVFEDFLNKQLHANIWDASYYSAAESLYPILIALVMVIVPYSKIVEVAVLAALIDLIQRSITPIKDVASKISVISRARTGIERVHQFNESFEKTSSDRMNFTGLEVKHLDFSLVHFQYDQGFILSDIKFSLERGQVLGILGESGCGKSTLMKLLSGQYHPFEGLIRIDEKAVNPGSDSELRNFSSYVSLVAQDSHVFTDTLKFNITLGDDDGFEKFWELAIEAIPYLGRWEIKTADVVKSSMLSMGQKQLASGLRALFLKKPIILMDEISSGLDSELESALRDLIKFFQSRSITIIVTHRLETIFNSDHLILLEQGKVLAQGSPTLLRENKRYQEFLAHLHS